MSWKMRILYAMKTKAGQIHVHSILEQRTPSNKKRGKTYICFASSSGYKQ
jgi:hypothetical protein